MDYVARSVGLARESRPLQAWPSVDRVATWLATHERSTGSVDLPEEIDPFDFFLFDDIQLPSTAAAHIEKPRVNASADGKTI